MKQRTKRYSLQDYYDALEMHEWNQTKAAKYLGVTCRTIRNYTKEIEEKILGRKIEDVKEEYAQMFFIFPSNEERVKYLNTWANRYVEHK